MIRLRFNGITHNAPIIVGPAASFRVEGPLLRQCPEGTVVGTYAQHHWETRGRHATSYETSDRVYVHGEDHAMRASRRYGPYSELRFPNGSCYADHVRFADYVDETQHWALREDGRHWPTLVITPADARTAH